MIDSLFAKATIPSWIQVVIGAKSRRISRRILPVRFSQPIVCIKQMIVQGNDGPLSMIIIDSFSGGGQEVDFNQASASQEACGADRQTDRQTDWMIYIHLCKYDRFDLLAGYLEQLRM